MTQSTRDHGQVTLADIEAAAERLFGQAVATPLLESAAVNARVGGRVLFKPENLQRTGSFKFRGAYNAVSQIDHDAHPGGVVAASSGNHAQGIAAAAQLCGLPAAIVMPSDAPALKISRTKSYGADVVLYDRATEDREAIAKSLGAERKADFVHPFDDPRVIAGQGTTGLEIAAQCHSLGVAPDQVLVCCAGGGLLSGTAIGVHAFYAAARVHPVEPAGFDDFARSLVSGQREVNANKSGSICDALLVAQPGAHTFEIARQHCGPGLVVSDAEASTAVKFAFEELKLVLEPGGAVALAAVLDGKIATADKTTVVVLSGGNVDPALFAKIIAAGE